MKIAIDQTLLLDRILIFALGERPLVDHTGIPQASIREAKQSGVLEGRVTLAQATRLANRIGVTLTELLTPQTTAVNANAATMAHDTADAQADAQVLVPLLHELTQLVDVLTLARTLGWDASRIESAINAADTALATSGLAIQRIRGQLKLRPAAPVDPTLRARIVGLRTSRRGLTQTEAAMLYKIVNGVQPANTLSNNARLVIGGLKNLGCIEPGQTAGRFQATKSLRLALPDL
ncbi:MAG: hypothetical protein HHJ11_13755 [Phycicoccus sp.]|nr:hypothetical protein [Phycicoccus sp.]